MSVVEIDRTQLQILLSRIVGAKFLSICTATLTEMNKTNLKKGQGLPPGGKKENPFYEKVVSVRRSTYMPCYDYDAGVERARQKATLKGEFSGEIEFEPGTTWYNRIIDAQGRATAFGVHKDTGVVFFAAREFHKGKTTYIALVEISDGDIIYPAGSEVPYEAMKEFMPPYKPSAKQGLGEENEVKARTLKIASIRAIRHEGQTYKIVQPLGLPAEEKVVLGVINVHLSQLIDATEPVATPAA